MAKAYKIIVGTYADKTGKFTWHDVSEHDDLDEAYKKYNAYVIDQIKYTEEELLKVWKTDRLDVELVSGNRLIKWVGLYNREQKLSEEAKKDSIDDLKKTIQSLGGVYGSKKI